MDNRTIVVSKRVARQLLAILPPDVTDWELDQAIIRVQEILGVGIVVQDEYEEDE